ncbi:flagellar brake protein [Geosporobacter ferrireducens]|uniref:Pilus assembly protein PilZ n=1 Tax=Geosporobacter ferrireducens TaxID=1424294 RepID=A0A1D8GBI1_9FIRM|nr:PilZ domain-containing protein [Geosporobacter ferrireducens]AOT68260.1 hypothetical protein Gferi_00860 [Geosporobacter ferrireducens]MTI57318.1 hypothetical protein [Geosporobacter ferrireducens]
MSSNVNLPGVGDKIEIEIKREKNFEKEKPLISQVLDVIDPQHQFIATPILNSTIVSIPNDTVIRVIYYKKSAGVYSYLAKIIGRKTVNNISYLKVQKIGNILKTQRRNFFRLDVVLNAKIKVIEPQENKELNIDVLTKDLSGGGTKMISKVKLSPGTNIQVTIEADGNYIITEGKIIRCIPCLESDYPFELGVIFEDIDEKIRTQIVSFIFDYQRKMRKKGLI